MTHASAVPPLDLTTITSQNNALTALLINMQLGVLAMTVQKAAPPNVHSNRSVSHVNKAGSTI